MVCNWASKTPFFATHYVPQDFGGGTVVVGVAEGDDGVFEGDDGFVDEAGLVEGVTRLFHGVVLGA